MARHYGDVFRFTDDLTATKNYGAFERSFRQNYPPVLN